MRRRRNRFGLVVGKLHWLQLAIVVDVRQFLSRLAQRGRGGRSMFLPGAVGGRVTQTNLVHELPGEIAVGFILVANDRRLTDIGNL